MPVIRPSSRASARDSWAQPRNSSRSSDSTRGGERGDVVQEAADAPLQRATLLVGERGRQVRDEGVQPTVALAQLLLVVGASPAVGVDEEAPELRLHLGPRRLLPEKLDHGALACAPLAHHLLRKVAQLAVAHG